MIIIVHFYSFIHLFCFVLFFIFYFFFQVLGLEVCADTLVGNQMLRGISGGQRKRVTTGKVKFVVDIYNIIFSIQLCK